ncbi:M3 family peptidase [Fulvimarina endophytica]|uniref:M3 family peptidase n=1 Tax=Fulvimarina endophytica TaxID=2293836 RepID=A0A371WZD7_9HYPH|nr:M3 family metallopeptidase [Fulvimarina endophytica]RFC62134.1 M3 family peptidase [Fulvimarina endophytica]
MTVQTEASRSDETPTASDSLASELHLCASGDAAGFERAIRQAIEAHDAEIAAITGCEDAPDFENTVKALEQAGRALSHSVRSFSVVAATSTTDEIQRLERDLSPVLSRHFSAIMLDTKLFARIDSLMGDPAAANAMTAQEHRAGERMHDAMKRAGAQLPDESRARLAEIETRLSELFTAFSQNILADERDWTMDLSEGDLGGLPDWLVRSLRAAGEERGRDVPVLTLSRSFVVPFLEHSDRADLRRKAFEAWTRRGESEGAHDNRPVMVEILNLRAEKARLLGYRTYAAFKLDDQMAKTPDTVRELLMRVWEPARMRAERDAEALGELARADGLETVAPSDWRYYAARRRSRDLDFDEAALKPYFSLDAMIEAAFDVANRLFGVRFEAIEGVKAWHPDVRAWRVLRADGREQGYFLGDYFARASKRSGAWMSVLRPQHRMDGGQTPIVYNVCNFAKPARGEPALLSLSDATTLYHEFGHALHGLLSDVEFPSLSGTAVARDFVELPSQLFEHWLMVPEILSVHARHVETGDPLPEAMVARMRKAKTLDAGFETVEYLASAIVDLDLHDGEAVEARPLETERETLRGLGMPPAIVMRHRTPHFAHVFSGEGYSAGYYSYLWSEVLDADAFEAFGEAGDPFHAETAARLLTHVYSAGNGADADILYARFRGREPDPAALMRKRGFAEAAEAAE